MCARTCTELPLLRRPQPVASDGAHFLSRTGTRGAPANSYPRFRPPGLPAPRRFFRTHIQRGSTKHHVSRTARPWPKWAVRTRTCFPATLCASSVNAPNWQYRLSSGTLAQPSASPVGPQRGPQADAHPRRLFAKRSSVALASCSDRRAPLVRRHEPQPLGAASVDGQ